MTLTHFRVGGWCDLCGGQGQVKFDHLDVDNAASPEVRQVLITVAIRVMREARARLDELEHAGRGCENAAERRFEQGRLQVVEHDLWAAVGITPVQDEPEPAGLVDIPLPGL